MYAKMEPASASILLREMERKHAASILNLTTERAAAAIMDATIQAGGTNAAVVAEWANIIRTMRIEKMSKAKE
jgi:flagellar motor switch protein FliG